ncbi:MAG: bifunctional UDP-N-acetylglucosamine diphosphorylase/glucosamine-1-phosphate N-acetyltransferase GlmU [Syntrophobacterales bacterium]|jgi:bifunctional UDP-N-acetylglucosamine pyrophosphorylase/glucosamine-1-phosphate N-acetyltransferase|nr:bifunctional UDP-N-acetylglucosamine diphosphorylase/glucosamine-1-phosphate N-acetyltransferase GlmU [Syntrophobacterales bacterium]
METLANNLTAVILAAGQGTRMKSKKPKVLHEILGRPMLAYLIDTLKSAGVDDIVLVVGHQAERVQEAYRDYGVRFVVQEPQLGTGHAVQVAMPAVPPAAGTVMVLCGDAPLISGDSILALQRLHKSTGAAITIQTIELADGAHYGRVVREAGQVKAIVQCKDAKDCPEILAIGEINTGAYCFDAAFLKENLSRLAPSPVTREIYLTDLIQMAREQGRAVAPLVDPDRDNLLGINSRAELAAATQTIKRAINARHLDRGVTFIDPESAYIESGVTIGQDTTIYPNVYLQGQTVIGEDCVIEASVKIVDSTLENNVYVKMGSVITQSRLAAGVDIGPCAHLRPGADLRQRVHVGNFVEVKKSVLHEGVKAGHLTYLGDAEVGAGTNVGAGTITCNYDGEQKHRTIIGEKVFIGSNTALVAPVTVGAGAYVGAGSTITKEVPPGKLGISRARQVNKERRLIGTKKK